MFFELFVLFENRRDVDTPANLVHFLIISFWFMSRNPIPCASLPKSRVKIQMSQPFSDIVIFLSKVVTLLWHPVTTFDAKVTTFRTKVVTFRKKLVTEIFRSVIFISHEKIPGFWSFHTRYFLSMWTPSDPGNHFITWTEAPCQVSGWNELTETGRIEQKAELMSSYFPAFRVSQFL